MDFAPRGESGARSPLAMSREIVPVRQEPSAFADPSG
jgi:hypothetical protein